jgi:hypothetical protein
MNFGRTCWILEEHAEFWRNMLHPGGTRCIWEEHAEF